MGDGENMGSLYIYKEVFEIISLSTAISIPFILLVLYKILNCKSLMYILCIYLLEVLMLVTGNYYFGVAMLNLVKISIIINKKANLRIKNRYILVIIGIYLFTVINLCVKNEFYMLTCTLMNLSIVQVLLISNMENIMKMLKDYKMKVKYNQSMIQSLIDKINLEFETQKKIKDSITEVNTELNKSIEESQNIVFLLNRDGEYLYGNEKFEEFICKNKSNLSDLDVLEEIKSKFIDFPEDLNGTEDLDTIINGYDEKIYRLTSKREILKNKYRNICILTDITESLLIRTKLEESEQRFKKLIDILSDGIIIHNSSSIKYINNKAIELFDIKDFDKSKGVLQNIQENMLSKSINKLIEQVNMVQSGKKDKVSIKINTKNKKVIEVITTSIILRGNKNLLTIAIDITNIENTISEIEQREKTYKVLLQTLPQGIAIIERNGHNHIYRNKVLIEILKEIGTESLNKVVKSYLNQLEYGKFKRFQVPSNKIKEIEVAIIDTGNSYLIILRTLDNEYKIKKMEEILSEINNKYRFNVEFLANVSKDIKKPVTTIFETNKLIYNYEKENNKGDNGCTKLIKQNCYRLMRLLDNILAIGHFENGTYKMEYKKYDIVSLLKDIVDKSKIYTSENGVNIEFKSNMDSKYMILDKEKIEKAILNLISNSIKYTAKGGEILVKFRQKRDLVYISVKDTGIGIPKDKIGIIFENFEQVDRTLTRGAEGTGIGLSLVNKLVKAHGGEIKVNSEVNVGSEFTIILKDNIKNSENIDTGASVSDNEKIDIEFSDIYFNCSS